MAKPNREHQAQMRDIFRKSFETIKEREALYGSGSGDLGRALAALFPDGLALVTAEDFARFHDFQQIVAKLNRYAKSFSEGGHLDSIHDAGNYAKLLEGQDRRKVAEDD